MKEMAQNNPILYIFIGCIDSDIFQGIKTIQEEHIDTKGVGYIHINKDTKIGDTLKDIELIHNKFITKRYQYSGEIKVNYLLDADDSFSLELLQIKKSVEYYLKYLYPTVILTDVFAIMNDATLLFSEERRYRKDVINMLNELQSDTCLVYILSNVNSKCVYEPDNRNNIINSISLIAILKDFVSLKPESINNNFYSERYFREDSLKYGGKLMTIGYADIKKPTQIIHKILLTKLLVFMDNDEYVVPIEFNLPKPMLKSNALLQDNLAGLPVSHIITENEKKTLTNKEALSLLFGNRLDLYFDLNFVQPSSEGILNEINYNLSEGFYAVYYITSPTGIIITRLRELQNQNNEANDNCETEYNNWLNQISFYGLKKPLFKVFDEYPLIIARKYLEFKQIMIQLKKEGQYIEQTINEVSEFHNNLLQMKNELASLVTENNEIIDRFIDDFELDRDFYESCLIKYLEDDFDEYLSVYQRMYDFLKNGELYKYTNLLQDYVEDKLSKIFNKPIIDEPFLINWANKNKIFNVFLKTGEKNLHCETNILLDIDSNLVLEKEKMNLFFENNKNGVAILYHVGGFHKEDLYYAELYDREI